MKKVLLAVLALVLVISVGAFSNADAAKTKTLKIGASNVPHAEILEKAAPLLAKKGIKLEITTFQDYILPNSTLKDKEIDANYFQHIPYLNAQNKEHGYGFVNAGGIHIEPIGVYSKKYKSLKKLPKGARILISNSVADHGRVLTLFQNAGLIKLKAGIDTTKATVKDIVSNPKKYKFEAKFEAGLLVQAYKNNEGDAVLINTNYAIDGGLNPLKDAIALEDSKSPYVNIIAVRKGDEKKAEIKTLVEVLRSKTIQDWIKTKYKGAVVPVSK